MLAVDPPEGGLRQQVSRWVDAVVPPAKMSTDRRGVRILNLDGINSIFFPGGGHINSFRTVRAAVPLWGQITYKLSFNSAPTTDNTPENIPATPTVQ